MPTCQIGGRTCKLRDDLAIRTHGYGVDSDTRFPANRGVHCEGTGCLPYEQPRDRLFELIANPNHPQLQFLRDRYQAWKRPQPMSKTSKEWRGQQWDTDLPMWDSAHPIHEVCGTDGPISLSAGMVGLPKIDDPGLKAELRAFAAMDKHEEAAGRAPTLALESIARQMVEKCASNDKETEAPTWDMEGLADYNKELGVRVAPQAEDALVKPHLNYIGGSKHASRHTKMAALLLYWAALPNPNQDPMWRCQRDGCNGCGGRKCPFSSEDGQPSEFARWVDDELGGYTKFYENRANYPDPTVPRNSSPPPPDATTDNQSLVYDFVDSPGKIGQLRLAGYRDSRRLWLSPDNPHATNWAIRRYDIPSALQPEGPPAWQLCHDPEPPHEPEIFDNRSTAGERLLELLAKGAYKFCPYCRARTIQADMDICVPCVQKKTSKGNSPTSPDRADWSKGASAIRKTKINSGKPAPATVVDIDKERQERQERALRELQEKLTTAEQEGQFGPTSSRNARQPVSGVPSGDPAVPRLLKQEGHMVDTNVKGYMVTYRGQPSQVTWPDAPPVFRIYETQRAAEDFIAERIKTFSDSAKSLGQEYDVSKAPWGWVEVELPRKEVADNEPVWIKCYYPGCPRKVWSVPHMMVPPSGWVWIGEDDDSGQGRWKEGLYCPEHGEMIEEMIRSDL
jgi:hypothetical protein